MEESGGSRRYRMTARQAAMNATRDAICAATVEVWLEVAYDDMTLDEVAERAGTTRQTVIRHFGSKENLVVEAGAWYAPQIEAMHRVTPGDVDAAVRAIVGRYEVMGDANVRMLEVEDRIEPVRQMLEQGRAAHREWVEATFAPVLRGRTRAERRAIVDALYTATDVTLWKTLRRDLGRSTAAVQDVMRRLLAGVIETAGDDADRDEEGVRR